MRWGWVALPIVLLAGCEARQTAPQRFTYQGLPVQGSLADAQHAGLTDCTTIVRYVRCRQDGVTFMGKGAYHAAVDVLYDDGSGGFYELTLWRDGDQIETYTVGTTLLDQGWQRCRTGPNENTGDQEIFTKAGSPVRISIDLSYWGKRRLRIIPELHQSTGRCW